MGLLNWIVVILVILSMVSTYIREPEISNKYFLEVGISGYKVVKGAVVITVDLVKSLENAPDKEAAPS